MKITITFIESARHWILSGVDLARLESLGYPQGVLTSAVDAESPTVVDDLAPHIRGLVGSLGLQEAHISVHRPGGTDFDRLLASIPDVTLDTEGNPLTGGSAVPSTELCSFVLERGLLQELTSRAAI